MAIRDVIAEEMRRDERVFIMGEDVKLGEVFLAVPEIYTRSLERGYVIHLFLKRLCWCRAACAGMWPIVELMYMDFTL